MALCEKKSFAANRMNILMQNILRIALQRAVLSLHFYSVKSGLDLMLSTALGRK